MFDSSDGVQLLLHRLLLSLKGDRGLDDRLGLCVEQFEERCSLIERGRVRDQRLEVEPPVSDEAHKGCHKPQYIPALLERWTDPADL